MTVRCRRCAPSSGLADASGRPQPPQNRMPAGLSSPQCAHVNPDTQALSRTDHRRAGAGLLRRLTGYSTNVGVSCRSVSPRKNAGERACHTNITITPSARTPSTGRPPLSRTALGVRSSPRTLSGRSRSRSSGRARGSCRPGRPRSRASRRRRRSPSRRRTRAWRSSGSCASDGSSRAGRGAPCVRPRLVRLGRAAGHTRHARVTDDVSSMRATRPCRPRPGRSAERARGRPES